MGKMSGRKWEKLKREKNKLRCDCGTFKKCPDKEDPISDITEEDDV